MKEFVKFTDHNDWEGESWNFWLQLDDNEQELAKLKTFLSDNRLENNPGYELDMTPVPEKEVDVVVRHSGQGYMNFQNKVVGIFTMPEFAPESEDIEDEAYDFAQDKFYKGDIVRHFK